MKKFHPFVLLLLAIAVSAEAAGPEQWTRESTRVFDDSYANIDIVPLNGQRFRAYFMRNGSIGSALSEDNGETFTDEGTVVSGSHHALVKLENNSYRMYYTQGASDDLLSATSSDGTTFTPEDDSRISGVGLVIHPSVVEVADGSFRVFYDEEREGDLNFGKKIRSMSCDSSGLTCTRDTGVRIRSRNCNDLSRAQKLQLKRRGILCDVNLVFSPFLEYDAETAQYRLYFTAEGNKKRSGVYKAISKNGLRFKIKNKVLGVNKNTTITDGSLGLPGNPQDAFIMTQNDGTKRMFVWETNDGIYAATLNP